MEALIILWSAALASLVCAASAGQQSWTNGRNLTEAVDLPHHPQRVNFTFTPFSRKGALLILLRGDKSLKSPLYYLQVQNGDLGPSFLAKCGGGKGVRGWRDDDAPLPSGLYLAQPQGSKYTLPGLPSRNCIFKMAFGTEDTNFSTWSENQPYFLKVSAAKSSVRLWLQGKLFEWWDPMGIPVTAYQLGTIGFSGKFDQTGSTDTSRQTVSSTSCLFSGKFCDIPCDINAYGETCERECGSCNQVGCDPENGQCLLGCQMGFLPPLCQNRTVHLVKRPKVTALSWDTMTVSVDLDSTTLSGDGEPRMFEVQYQKKGELWTRTSPQVVDGPSISTNITGLKPLTSYRVRVILYSDYNSSFEERDLPHADVKMKCQVPDDIEYQLSAYVTGEKRIRVSWRNDQQKDRWCPVDWWRVYIREANASKWTLYKEGSFRSTDMRELPEQHIFSLKVQAVILGEKEYPMSHEIRLTTQNTAPGQVRSLTATGRDPRMKELIWQHPEFDENVTLYYQVDYQCLTMFSCLSMSCESSAGTVRMVMSDNSLQRYVLKGLLPHAKYAVNVTAILMDIKGPTTAIRFITDAAAPEFEPEEDFIQVENVTESSFKITWRAPQSCQLPTGRYHGIYYKLFLAGVGTEVTQGDVYENSHFTFRDLRDSTKYLLRVHVMVNPGRWNPSKYLEKIITTQPLGLKLAVYQHGLNELGLRWRPPQTIRERLKFFTLTYSTEASENTTIDFVPKACAPWPRSFCYTIHHLQPRKKYTISIQAKLANGTLFGNRTTLEAETVEQVVVTPTSLEVIRQDPTSVTLTWSLPSAMTGKLSWFLVTAHHLESADLSMCCDPPARFIVNVTEKATTFLYTVPHLRPVSTYNVTVAGFTDTQGQMASVTAVTRPAYPKLPKRLAFKLGPGTCHELSIPNLGTAAQFVRSYTIAVIPIKQDRNLPALPADDAYHEMKEKFRARFRVLDEFTEEQVTVERTHCIDISPLDSRQEYRIGLAVLLAYKGTTTVAVTTSKNFLKLDCYTDVDKERYMCL